MFWLYFLAILPISIGLGLRLVNPKISWVEYAIGSALALITAIIFNIWAYHGQIGDKELWSGSIVQARQFSEWKEYYEYAVYKTEYYTDTERYTDSKGNSRIRTVRKSRQVFSHWQPTTRNHDAYWVMYSNIDTDYKISRDYYIQLAKKFGGDVPVDGTRKTGEHKSRMIGGDPKDYVATNNTGYIVPVNKSVYFENRIRASSSIFKKRSVSETEKKTLFEYPDYIDPFTSNRLLGTGSQYIQPIEWEKLNGYLGPIKKINLVCIGYPAGTDPSKFDTQIAYWMGGKKNDFIIGFSDGWSRVYSWSESELAKINIQKLFLNPKSPTLLEDIKKEILVNYTKVEWGEKFKYISVEPETHHIVIYLIVLVITQAGIYVFFHHNDEF